MVIGQWNPWFQKMSINQSTSNRIDELIGGFYVIKSVNKLRFMDREKAWNGTALLRSHPQCHIEVIKGWAGSYRAGEGKEMRGQGSQQMMRVRWKSFQLFYLLLIQIRAKGNKNKTNSARCPEWMSN